MNQFEAARLKTQQREERKARYAQIATINEPVVEEHPIHEIPKEKPKAQKDGRFTVLVEMPHATFTFVITKPSILSHAHLSKLTQSEIRKHIVDGLKPLLGGLD